MSWRDLFSNNRGPADRSDNFAFQLPAFAKTRYSEGARSWAGSFRG
jgi:hypothetical protein